MRPRSGLLHSTPPPYCAKTRHTVLREKIMATDLSFVCIAVYDLQEATDRFCNLYGLQVMQPPNDNTQFGYRNAFLGNGRS